MVTSSWIRRVFQDQARSRYTSPGVLAPGRASDVPLLGCPSRLHRRMPTSRAPSLHTLPPDILRVISSHASPSALLSLSQALPSVACLHPYYACANCGQALFLRAATLPSAASYLSLPASALSSTTNPLPLPPSSLAHISEPSRRCCAACGAFVALKLAQSLETYLVYEPDVTLQPSSSRAASSPILCATCLHPLACATHLRQRLLVSSRKIPALALSGLHPAGVVPRKRVREAHLAGDAFRLVGLGCGGCSKFVGWRVAEHVAACGEVVMKERSPLAPELLGRAVLLCRTLKGDGSPVVV